MQRSIGVSRFQLQLQICVTQLVLSLQHNALMPEAQHEYSCPGQSQFVT